MDIWNAVSAICAVLTVIGAGLSWWRSNLSREAQRESFDAVERAETEAKAAHAKAYEARRQVEVTQKLVEALNAQVAAAEAAAVEAKHQADHSESQATDIKKIADSLRGPDFEVQQIGKALFALTNNTTKPVTVESVVNRGSFYRLDMPLEQWTLDPYETFQFMALGISGLPLPQNLVLKFVDREDPVKVALIKSL